MKYDDLLAVPFKWGGRDKSGMDCYGIVVECCKRAGTPLNDPFRELSASIPEDEAMRIRKEAINAREVKEPAVGRVIYGEWDGRSHVGYIVERGKVLHARTNGFPRISPLFAFKDLRFFEVANDEAGK